MTPAVSAEQGSANEEPATRFNAATFAFEKTAPKAKSKKTAGKAKRGKATNTKATGSHEKLPVRKAHHRRPGVHRRDGALSAGRPEAELVGRCSS
jgi:hypothetical protein